METMSVFLSRDIPAIRLATWNIDARKEGRDKRLTPIIETLRPLDVDVVCIQECWVGAEKEIASALGMNNFTFYDAHDKETFGNAIISRLPLTLDYSIEHALLPGLGEKPHLANLVAMTVQSKSGRTWRIGSTHLNWGGGGEGVRLGQVQEIEKLAKQAEMVLGKELVQVLAGDFNALPESSTLRYITGLDGDRAGESTLWVDAWATRENSPGYTSTNDNPMVEEIARRQGILNPVFLPNRRIDYILTRGFAYGRPGSPINVKLLDRPFNGKYGSDHYGIVANLWDPEI